MLRFYAAFAFLFIFSNQKIAACGYSFIGDCSTNISLKINGTQDSFAVANCPDVLKFDGFALGSLQTLSIARAKAATWESCLNNVSGVALFYRVYEQGFAGGSWQNLALQEDYNALAGPYTTRYRSKNANISLTNGLTVGKTYVFEIYFRAEIDTLGDDFIPETTLLQNNNGQNYHFTFQYGGASAPPFLVATTKVVPVKCNGDSTGVAGVTVYGNQSGLFYQWSTGGNNFYILSKIPAGTYSVTVTGAGGYSASDTMEITQPMPLAVQFSASGLGCDGTLGQAAATPSGGTKSYYYEWENGDQDSIASFPNSGDVALTVTDGNGCSAVFSVNISAQPIVTVNVGAEICEGEMYAVGGVQFTQPGFYIIDLLGANGACDTLFQLSLEVLPPPTVSAEFEVIEPFACFPSDSVHLLLKAVTNAQQPSFDWIFDGQVISTADTCNFVVPGSATGPTIIPTLTVTDEFGCSAQTVDTGVAISQPFPLQVAALVTNPNAGFENGSIALTIFGGTPTYAFQWSNNSNASAIFNLGPGTYCATVTDEHGCTITICETLESAGVTGLPFEHSMKIFPNPAMTGQEVKITFPENFAEQEVLLEILDLQGRTLLRQMTPLNQRTASVSLPQNLPAGIFTIKSTGIGGKSAIGRFSVH